MRERPIVTPGLMIGLFAVAAGVILLLDRQGLIDAPYVFGFFWPALLLTAGIFRLAQPCEGPGRVWGGFLAAAGTALSEPARIPSPALSRPVAANSDRDGPGASVARAVAG